MTDFTLKLYHRDEPHTSPGRLVGQITLFADDSETATARALHDFASVIAAADYAFIQGPHGRIVWERSAEGGPRA